MLSKRAKVGAWEEHTDPTGRWTPDAGLRNLSPTKKGSVEGAHCIIVAESTWESFSPSRRAKFEFVFVDDQALILSSLDVDLDGTSRRKPHEHLHWCMCHGHAWWKTRSEQLPK